MSLPNDYKARKDIPLFDFLTKYFPDSIVELVKVSVAGNAQHNPGEPLHWAREKSTDQLNTAMRHMFDHGAGNVLDTDGTMHLAKAAWRLLAEIQLLREARETTARLSVPEATRHQGWIEGCSCTMCTREQFRPKVARTPGDDVDFPVNR